MQTLERKITVEGGEYRDKASGERITATCWRKDGDHELVVRYPIEGRVYKGLLIVGEKDKHALRYGDWVCKDAKGRMYVVSAESFADRYEPVTEAST